MRFVSLLLSAATVVSVTAIEQDGCIGLECFSQWRNEDGYWLGEFTFYQGDGTAFESEEWNYPFNNYKGFITGAINCYKYRQRNVFMYPPQTEQVCKEKNNSTIGEGLCGENGNTKIFFADQEVRTTTSSITGEKTIAYENWDGRLEGSYAGIFETKTTLIGDDNGVLYQVFDADGGLFASSTTTITQDATTGMARRTRSQQGFFQGIPTTLSFYRERKVTKEEFYNELEATLLEYNILDSDACTWMEPGPVPSPYTPGFNGCVEHLEASFELKNEECVVLHNNNQDDKDDTNDGADNGNVDENETKDKPSGSNQLQSLYLPFGGVTTLIVLWLSIVLN